MIFFIKGILGKIIFRNNIVLGEKKRTKHYFIIYFFFMGGGWEKREIKEEQINFFVEKQFLELYKLMYRKKGKKWWKSSLNRKPKQKYLVE